MLLPQLKFTIMDLTCLSGEDLETFWTFSWKKNNLPLGTMDYSLASKMLRKKKHVLDIWLMKFKRGSKILSEPFIWYFKLINCGIEMFLCFTETINVDLLGLRTQLWLIIHQYLCRGISWKYFLMVSEE